MKYTGYDVIKFELRPGERIVEDWSKYPAPTGMGMERISRPTPYEQLKDREQRLTTELAQVREAIAAMEANPTVTEVMEKIARALY